jgi:hypothetical protein
VQLLYTNAREPEVATIVRDGDVVLMPALPQRRCARPSSFL